MTYLAKLSGLVAAIAFVSFAATAPAYAYIACSKGGDCWYSARNDLKIPNVPLTYFPDSDLNRIKNDKHYTWHASDGFHNWLNGYWIFGMWYSYS